LSNNLHIIDFSCIKIQVTYYQDYAHLAIKPKPVFYWHKNDGDTDPFCKTHNIVGYLSFRNVICY